MKSVISGCGSIDFTFEDTQMLILLFLSIRLFITSYVRFPLWWTTSFLLTMSSYQHVWNISKSHLLESCNSVQRIDIQVNLFSINLLLKYCNFTDKVTFSSKFEKFWREISISGKECSNFCKRNHRQPISRVIVKMSEFWSKG